MIARVIAPCVAALWVLDAGATEGFASARAAAAQLPRLHSLVVNVRGRVAFEYHAPGVRPGTLANVKSVSKSVISTLVGIAIDRRLIGGVNEPIVRWFPELRRDRDRRKQAITIDDLLTMRSGLESTSGEQYGPWVRSRNWVRYALARPMVSEPGGAMEYSTGTSHILSAILTKAARKSTHAFAAEALAAPLGMSLARWPRDPQGVYFGGNEMLMTPRQMVALGELYLNRGRAGGRQVVSEAWVEQSCTPRTRSRWDSTREYGYGWWIQQVAGHTACFAWGFGGQYILVFRDLGIVVAVTSSTHAGDERRGYRGQLFDMLETHVLPDAIRDPRSAIRGPRSAVPIRNRVPLPSEAKRRACLSSPPRRARGLPHRGARPLVESPAGLGGRRGGRVRKRTIAHAVDGGMAAVRRPRRIPEGWHRTT